MSVRDTAMQVIVDNENIRVVSAGDVGPASLALNSMIVGSEGQVVTVVGGVPGFADAPVGVPALGADEIIAGDASGDPTPIANVVYARSRGAAGDGSTDDTVDIATAQTAAAARAGANSRSILALSPGDTYKIGRKVGGSQVDGGIRLDPGVELDGKGATLLLADNCAFVQNHMANVAVGTDNPTSYGTGTAATITANVAVNATQYTVNSTTGFAADDEVFVRLNDNAYDSNETKDTFFAKVLSVDDATHLTLDRPAPVACTVASQAAGNKIIQKLFHRTDGYHIANLTLVNPQTGSANAESGIDLRFARNSVIENIVAVDPGAGAVLLAYPENVTLRNIRVRRSDKQGSTAKGRALNIWNAKNVRIENLYAEHFERAAVLLESYCRGVVFDGVHLVNNHPSRNNATDALFVINQGSEATFRNVLIEGTGDCSLVDESATTGNRIVFEDLWINTTTTMLDVDLSTVRGALRIGTTAYAGLVTRTIPFRIPPSNSATFDLPTGLYRRIKIYVSTTTGMGGGAGIYLVNGSGGTSYVTPHLVAGDLVDLPTVARYGSSYLFNTTDMVKTFSLYTDGTTPAGQYGFIEVEYWPTVDDDGSKGMVQTQSLNPPAYTITNLTEDRTYDANATTTAELADILGTLINDLKQSGWIA